LPYWISAGAPSAAALQVSCPLIGALQASTAVILTAYYGKSKAENTLGGIAYDTAVNEGRDC
jgi:hypothetical protein